MSEWMLWNRFGGSIKLGSAPPPRLYFIPLSTSIDHEGPLALQLGHKNRDERNLEGFTRALDRAVSCESDGVIFPGSFLTLPFRYDVISRCQHRKLRIVHQITTDTLTSEKAAPVLDELMKRLDAGDAANIVFGAGSLPKETLLARLTRWPDQVYFTYSARSKDPVIEMLHKLQPFLRARLFFHFPFRIEFGDEHFSCSQIHDLILKISSRVPGIVVRPMLGTEMFDPRVDPSLDLEPTIEPLIELRSNNGLDHKNRVPIEVSVIIPSYNNREYLLNTIKHLVRQDFNPGSFEIIVVDDGSTDGTGTAVQQLVAPLDGKINLKYIFSPRAKPRKMGDANYRAGISRNLGVKNAAGKILSFLDSDILTPPDFISDIVEKHKSYDVIQCKRLNLVREKSDATIAYQDVDAANDTFHTEDGYWEKFYAIKDWPKTPFFWKYTCTYGLSVSARLFKRVGWIRRGFVFYGFEDVELGYRLARVGARFHLNDTVTYHLFHKNERSEFHNSDYLRQSLLAKTAQIFFLNLLEPEIYFHFRGLMKEQVPLASILAYILRKAGLIASAEQVVHAAERTSHAPIFQKTLGALQTPFLAAWNWRWFLWREWNRMRSRISFVRIPFREKFNFLGNKIDSLIGQSWRLRVLSRRTIDLMQLWRAKAIVRSVWNQRWHLNVATKRIANALQIWRIPIWMGALAGQFWRVRVMAEKAVAVLQLWRLRVVIINLQAPAWRLRVLAVRLKGALLRELVAGRSTYPFRKVYYVSSFQWNSRVRNKQVAEKNEHSVGRT